MLKDKQAASNDLATREARLRCVHNMLKLKQSSPEAAAAVKRIARAEVEAYEAALREHGIGLRTSEAR